MKSDYLKSFLLLLFLFLPNLAVLKSNHVHNAEEALAIIFFSLLILVSPLLVFNKLKHFFILWTPLVPLILPYIYLMEIYQSVPSDALIATTLHQNIGSSLEVIFSFGWKIWLIPLATLIYIAAVYTINVNMQLTEPSRKKLLAGLLLFILLSLWGRQIFAHSNKFPPFFEDYTAYLSFPSNLIRSISRSIEPEPHLMEFTSIHGRSPQEKSAIVVLVIGESVRSDHLSINGYARHTTPLLKAYGSDVISYKDVASTANCTYGAVPNLVVMPLDNKRVSLVQTFREAGYKTAWFSNEEMEWFSTQADVSSFAESSYDTTLRKDTYMLPFFESFVRQGGNKQLIVLHMYGSHFPYDHRYSSDSHTFSPTLSDAGVQEEPTSGNKLAIINSYDNSIVEMDKFLNKTISILSSEPRPVIMLYTSDHGENLFDDDRNLFMHCQAIPTHADIHVPLIIWMNPAYKSAFPSIAKVLIQNINKKISHVNIFPTLLELGEIDSDTKISKNSFSSHEFIEKERFVQGGNGSKFKYIELR